jgi:anti-anti-sigma factor
MVAHLRAPVYRGCWLGTLLFGSPPRSGCRESEARLWPIRKAWLVTPLDPSHPFGRSAAQLNSSETEASVVRIRGYGRSSDTKGKPAKRQITRLDRKNEMASINYYWESPGKLVIAIAGEVDLSNVGTIRDNVEAVKSSARLVVFDLSGLDFIDSSGLALLVALAGEVGRAQLRSPSPFVQRIVDLTALGELLPAER